MRTDSADLRQLRTAGIPDTNLPRGVVLPRNPVAVSVALLYDFCITAVLFGCDRVCENCDQNRLRRQIVSGRRVRFEQTVLTDSQIAERQYPVISGRPG